ncbi:MAG: Ppx/GppA phosphatase family protein [Pseudomonadota bacterium]
MASQSAEPLGEGSQLAAIDLGSNSFHLIIARIEHGEMRPVEALAEKVQLGAGLKNGKLSRAAIERGLDCLTRFAQLLEHVEPERMRIVGTNALRQASNRKELTRAAKEILGQRVDVIYGREEARLVYLGVAHTLADDAQSRLVVDIGGGSTEFIIGERFEPQHLESLQMGCVSYGQACFANGEISKAAFKAAYDRASVETSHIRHEYHSGNWEECVGSSGTLNAIEMILSSNGMSSGGITRDGLEKLRKRLLKFERVQDIRLEGLSEPRRSVIVPGVAIALALFDVLDIDVMRASKGALREGVIYDLMGRLQHEDVRERTISALTQRFGADDETAAIVDSRARILFRATRKPWKLERSDGDLLHWAARSHEIGMNISHKHFHRHSAYLLRNADLPGFSQGEQEQLAVLAQGHRGKLTEELFEQAPDGDRDRLLKLLTLIRLAALFKYVEKLEQLPDFMIVAGEDRLALGFPEGWLEAHPLTAQELANERQSLARLGIRLSIVQSDQA